MKSSDLKPHSTLVKQNINELSVCSEYIPVYAQLEDKWNEKNQSQLILKVLGEEMSQKNKEKDVVKKKMECIFA